MNKTWKRAGATVLAGGAFALAAPADAAGPYAIAAPSVGSFSAARQAFVTNGCSLDGPGGVLDGTDAKIVDATGLASRSVSFSWTAPLPTTGLGVAQYTAACTVTGEAGTPPELNVSGSVIRLSSNTKWLVVHAYRGADITFNVNPV